MHIAADARGSPHVEIGQPSQYISRRLKHSQNSQQKLNAAWPRRFTSKSQQKLTPASGVKRLRLSPTSQLFSLAYKRAPKICARQSVPKEKKNYVNET
jgi:hypothetical protein